MYNEFDELEKRYKEHRLFHTKGIDKKDNWFNALFGPMPIKERQDCKQP